MKGYRPRLLVIVMFMSVLIMLSAPGQGFAGQSFTASMSFFQGFDLEQGMTEEETEMLLQAGSEDQTVLRLVFLEEDIEPEPEAQFSGFSPAIDFFIGREGDDLVGFAPTGPVAMAVINDQSFSSVDFNVINSLDFNDYSDAIQFDPNYTIVLLTGDDSFYKVGNFSQTNVGVSFEYQKLDFEKIKAVPEPSTILLIGVGLAGLGSIRRRKKHQNNIPD